MTVFGSCNKHESIETYTYLTLLLIALRFHSQSELAGRDECLGAALVLTLVLAVGVGAVDGLHVVLQDGEALQHQAALVARLRADPVGGGLGGRLGLGMVDLWPMLKSNMCRGFHQ